MPDVLSGVAKNGMGCFVPGCFVLHLSGADLEGFICIRVWVGVALLILHHFSLPLKRQEKNASENVVCLNRLLQMIA